MPTTPATTGPVLTPARVCRKYDRVINGAAAIMGDGENEAVVDFESSLEQDSQQHSGHVAERGSCLWKGCRGKLNGRLLGEVTLRRKEKS